MRIAIATNFLYPETLGGTEIYCHQLTESLAKKGHEVYWFVPNFNKADTVTSTNSNAVNIVRFAAVKEGESPNADFVATSFILEITKRNITVAHFHEFGGFEGISNNLLTRTKEAGIRTVVSLHLVQYICRTGTLRFGSTEPCNGKVIVSRCGSCKFFSNATGIPTLNYLLSSFFTPVFNVVEKGNLAATQRMKQVMNNLSDRFPFINALKEHADVIISLTQRFREVLIVNGISPDKIVHIPQASPSYEQGATESFNQRKGFVFIGRVNKEKGIDLLLKAAIILQRKNPSIYIDLYGPIPVTGGKEDSHSFLEKIKALPNIRYKRLLAPQEVIPTIAKYKTVLLPSLVAEMAPMIIMEANKLQTPVIGADVPGVTELINGYNAGLIFKYNDAADLAEKIITIEKGECRFEFNQPIQNDFDGIATKCLELYNISLNSTQNPNAPSLVN